MGNKSFLKILSVALVASLLAACGGGAAGYGGSTGSTTGGTTGSTTGGTTGTTTPTTYKVGNLDTSTAPATFNPGLIAVGTATLGVGGQTTLRVDIVDANNVRATAISSTVVFSSDCVAAGKATISPSTTTNATGRVDATYTAAGCSGSDTIRAQVTAGTNATVIVNGTVTVATAPIGSIAPISVTPSVIGLSGSTTTNQSVVKFQVLDQTGNPVSAQTVNFSLSATPGGLSLSPTSSKSDNNGYVQTVVKAGSLNATVTVKAETTDTSSGLTISNLSDGIAVTTGLPTASALSVSSDKGSVDGTCDGEVANITVRMADRYSNPVPVNTQPLLSSSGGKIVGTCKTSDPSNSSQEPGACTVKLFVQDPRPANGKAVILVRVAGEESYVDNNLNGFFDAGDTYTDLPEPFLDANYNGIYDAGEYAFDVNSNGHWDGPNGQFDGYVCDSPGVNCRSNPTTISNSPVGGASRQFYITFSGGDATASTIAVNVAGSSSTFSGGLLALKGAKSLAGVTLTVGDSGGNALPAGTTYTLKTQVGSVLDPATVGPFVGHRTAESLGYVIQAPDSTTADPGGLVSIQVVQPATGCSGTKTTTINLFQVKFDP